MGTRSCSRTMGLWVDTREKWMVGSQLIWSDGVLIYERTLITISTLLYPSPSTQQYTYPLLSIVHGTHDSFCTQEWFCNTFERLVDSDTEHQSSVRRAVVLLFLFICYNIRKELGLRLWSSPQQGSWAIANRIPPSLTLHLELAGRRELFELLQCRTGHSYSEEYYRRFVPSADPAFPCRESIQTREHVIQSCPTYERHRTALRKVSQMLSSSAPRVA